MTITLQLPSNITLATVNSHSSKRYYSSALRLREAFAPPGFFVDMFGQANCTRRLSNGNAKLRSAKNVSGFMCHISCDRKKPCQRVANGQRRCRSCDKTLSSCGSSSDRSYIVINVSGRRFKTEERTLEKYPDTLLGGKRRHYYYDLKKQEFFFDRDPDIFSYILKFYRTGKIHYPENECCDLFESELRYFGILPDSVPLCCAEYYEARKNVVSRYRREIQEKVRIKEKNLRTLDDCRTLKQKLWMIFEQPTSSVPGLTLWIITTFFIIVTVVTLVMETVPKGGLTWGEVHPMEFNLSNTVCVAYFTFEYILKLYSSPDRLQFIRQFSNVIDLISVLPFYIGLAAGNNSNSKFLVILRVLRVTRVVKISRFSAEKMAEHRNLLKQNRGELTPLLLCFVTVLIIFSSVIYYIELLGRPNADSDFPNIPACFWYTIVTMTSLGYGDVVPLTVFGKVVGGLCSLSGIFLIALMAPLLQKN